MKKVIFSLAIILAGIFSMNAQSAIRKGDVSLNVGMGIGSHHGSAAFMPTVDLETGIISGLAGGKGAITVGGRLGYYGTEHNFSAIILATKLDFHYQLASAVDGYLGQTLGGYFGNDTGFVYGIHLGARFFVQRDFALFSEVSAGWATPFVMVGVSFRL